MLCLRTLKSQVPTSRCFSTSSPSFFLGKLNKHLQATTPKEHVVITLTKPIGVREEPKDTDNSPKDPRSIKEKYKDFLDPEKNKKRQEELEKEMSRSGMYDLYVYRKTKGKLFLSPQSYWKAEKSLYFPNFVGEDLTSSKLKGTTSLLKGKVSVIRAYTADLGEKASKGYFKVLDNDYLTTEGYDKFLETNPNSQIVDLNITENGLKAIFVKASKSGLRKVVHESRYDKYLIVPKKGLNIDVRESIHLLNNYTCFIYVVDHQGRIRWATCGEPTEADRNMLWRTVRGLEREYKALNPTEKPE